MRYLDCGECEFSDSNSCNFKSYNINMKVFCNLLSIPIQLS
jgi:hypothetical protein